jgi:hypothetical protein
VVGSSAAGASSLTLSRTMSASSSGVAIGVGVSPAVGVAGAGSRRPSGSSLGASVAPRRLSVPSFGAGREWEGDGGDVGMTVVVDGAWAVGSGSSSGAGANPGGMPPPRPLSSRPLYEVSSSEDTGSSCLSGGGGGVGMPPVPALHSRHSSVSSVGTVGSVESRHASSALLLAGAGRGTEREVGAGEGVATTAAGAAPAGSVGQAMPTSSLQAPLYDLSSSVDLGSSLL